MQEKKKELSNTRKSGSRPRHPIEAEIERDTIQISNLEAVLNLIPADIISRRAVECKSFSRALFHWEQYMRQEAQKHAYIDQPFNPEPLFERLQDIYTQIDEPDGIEGISAHLQVLNIDQQILEHRNAGRWFAAQSWYEILLTERPGDLDVQHNLLTSLKESGQYGKLPVGSYSPIADPYKISFSIRYKALSHLKLVRISPCPSPPKRRGSQASGKGSQNAWSTLAKTTVMISTLELAELLWRLPTTRPRSFGHIWTIFGEPLRSASQQQTHHLCKHATT